MVSLIQRVKEQGIAKKKSLDDMARCLGKAIDLCLREDSILMPEEVYCTIIGLSFDGYLPESMMETPSAMLVRLHNVKSRPQFQFKKMKLSEAVNLALDNSNASVHYMLDGKHAQNQGKRYVYFNDEETLRDVLRERLHTNPRDSSSYLLDVF